MLLRAVFLAELGKLRTLPIATATFIGAIVAGAAVAAAVATATWTRQAPLPFDEVLRWTVPTAQALFVLLGMLPIGQEYAGHQLRTTLLAVPKRGLLLVAKSAAALMLLLPAAAATVVACWLAAATAGLLSDGPGLERQSVATLVTDGAGAAAYLALIGALGYVTALLIRRLLPALAVVLGAVLLVSPVVAGLSEHARWLPDRAAALLYGGGDAVLTAGSGTAVAAGWILLIGGIGAVRLLRSDA